MSKKRLAMFLRLLGLVRFLWGFLILGVILGLLGSLCAALIPVVGSYALLSYLQGNSGIQLGTFLGILLLLAVLRGLLRYGEAISSTHVANTGLATLRDRLFTALRKMGPGQFSRKDQGNLVSVLTSDIELLEVFYAHTLGPILSTALYVCFLSVFIGTFHPVLGLLALCGYIVVGFVIPYITAKAGSGIGHRIRNLSGALSGTILENIQGLSETLQYGGSKERLGKMNDETASILREEKQLQRNTGFSRGFTDGTVIFFDVCMLLVSGVLYRKGIVGFGGVLIPTITVIGSFEPCLELASLGSHITKTFGAGRRILAILDETPAVSDIEGQAEIQFEGATVENVSFSLDGYPVLLDASLNIPKNAIIGLTGPSSSGKSILLKLLMRFWKTEEGCVRISQTSIEQVNTENLRRMESLMSQETFLFRDSIRNNVGIAKLDATQAEIEAACKKASIHDFIMRLPQGYDTMVGGAEDCLSGGERQRIGLARAFLHGAPFLLLDEPTSNLDSFNEAVILRSLHNQRKDKTILLVSHRNSALCIADKVYSVERGSVAEVR